MTKRINIDISIQRIYYFKLYPNYFSYGFALSHKKRSQFFCFRNFNVSFPATDSFDRYELS